MSVNSVNADGSLTKIAGSGSADTSVLKGDFSVVESTSTATRAYSIGDCFIMETGQLVRATSAIAINDTIAIGTNVAATSVVQLLSAKIDTSQKGANNGIAELDSSGKVPTTQLPSYVDDVVNGYLHEGTFYYDDQYTEPITPEDDKIYVDKTEDKTYRWGGESYVEVGGGGVALGETSTTAYRGDRGKTAYDHSQDSGKLTTATASGFYKVASTSEGHIAGLTLVEKSDITALGIPAQDTTYGVVSKTENGLCPVLPNETTTTKYLRQDGSWQVPPDNNTTYTFTGGTNKFTVTPSGGTAQDVTVTPSITNNVTGSGTSGYIAKFNGTNTITNGPAFGSSTTTFLRNDGSWATTTNFSGTTFYSGNGSTAEHNANNMAYNGTYYYTSNGPATSLGASTADGAIYAQAHSTSWVGQIAQDYRNGNIFVRGKNNNTWTAWKKVDAGTVNGITLSLVN